MSDGHRLAQLMRQAGKTPQNELVDLVIGEVTSIEPLKVKIENRELTESFLIVGALCQEKHIYTDDVKKLSHSHKISSLSTQSAGGETIHSHGINAHDTQSTPQNAEYDILLWRGLEKGDKVLMLKVSRGQRYFILQRCEEKKKQEGAKAK